MDPTGMSSTFGQLVIGAMLIATIVVLVLFLRRRRR
jgi:LPXTG-motif cell wall-anchored protein